LVQLHIQLFNEQWGSDITLGAKLLRNLIRPPPHSSICCNLSSLTSLIENPHVFSWSPKWSICPWKILTVFLLDMPNHSKEKWFTEIYNIADHELETSGPSISLLETNCRTPYMASFCLYRWQRLLYDGKDSINSTLVSVEHRTFTLPTRNSGKHGFR